MKWQMGFFFGLSVGVLLTVAFHLFSNFENRRSKVIKEFAKVNENNEECPTEPDVPTVRELMRNVDNKVSEVPVTKTTVKLPPSSDMDQSTFMKIMEAIQHERKVTMKRACRKLNESKRECPCPKTYIHKNSFYSTTYKYLVCYIQKCGFSNWLRAVMVQEGFYTVDDYRRGKIVGEDVIEFSKKKRQLSFVQNPIKRMEIWNHSLKIVQVRNPFERLVSAYNDKMVPFQGILSPFYGPISRDINRLFKHLRHKESDRTKNDTTASFEDFVNYLIKTKNKDSHWDFYDTSCQPCKVDYDYIVKFETLHEDIQYLKIKLNISEEHQRAFFPMQKIRTDNDKVEKHYSLISKDLANRLYTHYRRDFLLFGYEYPLWLC